MKTIARLYFIHIFAWLAVWLATYYPGLDIVLAVLYLLIITMQIRSLGGETKCRAIKVFLIWQAPGIVFSLISLLPWSWWGIKEYAFFLLMFWYTPVVPLLSLLQWVVAGYPIYYYLLLAMPLIYGLIFMVLTRIKQPVLSSSRIRYLR
ncbi:MAG TPA: hypothetical protein PLM20_00890 [Syntrophomonadaceae bacterium]|nr:hypothetical protein [Syntrophomonadaceae bacterium]HQA07247.1 hypothetical protein [Syntrophomonadaceae bacterium]HQE22436.1 hypothetical protein [Syntrophomonadaceae bacterium]